MGRPFFSLLAFVIVVLVYLVYFQLEYIPSIMVFKPYLVNYSKIISKFKERNFDNVVTSNHSDADSSEDSWKFDYPILDGWPPDANLNLSFYLQPDTETTIIEPRNVLERIATGDENQNEVLIVCHSAFSPDNLALRNTIRKTWGLDASQVPVVIIFLLGVPTNSSYQAELEAESDTYGDILQENFIDSYNNLTIKSMFMLKYLNKLAEYQKVFKFIFKVDDDCYVNVKGLHRYTKTIAKYQNTIFGHVLSSGSDNHVNRPLPNATGRFIDKWEVPNYLYPNKTSFPMAVSGAGYLLRIENVPCMYQRGLNIPFVNLEDVFITGLISRQCHLKLMNQPSIQYMGLSDVCKVRKKDLLVHEVKDPQYMLDLHELFHEQKNCLSLTSYNKKPG